jgi:hypothetical protein
MDGINPRATVQKLNLDENALRIQVPFSMSISGPSQSIYTEIINYSYVHS